MTHKDLTISYQLPQCCHAVADFSAQYPEQFKKWQSGSNTIVVLAVSNERRLFELAEKAEGFGLKVCRFHEPDLCNELTAIAIEPSDTTRRICGGIGLAGRKQNENAEQNLDWKFALAEKMMVTRQTDGVNMLEHGQQVYAAWQQFLGGEQQHHDEWVELDFAKKVYESIDKSQLPDVYSIWKYMTMHDCGKPDCLLFDSNGKRHYPNHAQVSASVFAQLFPEEDAAKMLIANDMLFHSGTLEQIQEFMTQHGSSLTKFLWLSAYCALHANNKAGMWDSNSLKSRVTKIIKKLKSINLM